MFLVAGFWSLLQSLGLAHKSGRLLLGNVVFTTYDLGGHKEARRLWKEYFSHVEAIVYLIDASDMVCLEESKRELDLSLQDAEIGNVTT